MHRLPNTPSQLHEMNEIHETNAPPPHEANEIQQHTDRRAPRTSRSPNTPSQLHEMNEIQLYETNAPPPHATNEIQQHAERRAPRTSYAMQKETTHRPPEDLHNKGEEKTEATAKSTQPNAAPPNEALPNAGFPNEEQPNVAPPNVALPNVGYFGSKQPNVAATNVCAPLQPNVAATNVCALKQPNVALPNLACKPPLIDSKSVIDLQLQYTKEALEIKARSNNRSLLLQKAAADCLADLADSPNHIMHPATCTVSTFAHDPNALKCKVRFATWNVSGVKTAPAKLATLSWALQSEKVDACVLGETRQRDGLLLSPLLEMDWHVAAQPRVNHSNGGVALLLNKDWDRPDIVDTGLEDVICAKISNRRIGRAYHLIGVYIPHGSTSAHSKRVFDCIRRLCARLPNPVVLGDLNAHLPDAHEDFIRYRSEYPSHSQVPPRAKNEWAKPPNDRGKQPDRTNTRGKC